MHKSVLLTSMVLVTLLASISAQYMASQDGEYEQNSAIKSAKNIFKTPVDQDDLDYYGVVLANLLSNRQIQPEKRSCIRRGGTCDHRPNDCCPKSSCRCNLWGTNCRCQRLGLFQKWGKKR